MVFLAQKAFMALLKRRTVELIVLYRIPDVLSCGADQEQYLPCAGREQNSIAEARDVKHTKSRLLPINIRNSIDNTGELKEELCSPNYALVCLRVFVDKEV